MGAGRRRLGRFGDNKLPAVCWKEVAVLRRFSRGLGLPEVGFQAQRRRGSLAGSWDAKGRVPGTARVLSRKRFQDGTGRLGWFWRSGLDRARWIAGSGLDLAEWSGSGRMDWLGAR